MSKWPIVREMMIIISFTVTVTLIFALLTGATLTNESIVSILIFAVITGLSCSIFYIDPLVDFLGIFWVQATYILLVGGIFMACNQIFTWRVPLPVIGLALLAIVACFFIGKAILFSISVKITNQMNRQLQKKFPKKDED